MFIVRHKDTLLDGTAPALQYGQCPLFHVFFGMRGLTGDYRIRRFQYLYQPVLQWGCPKIRPKVQGGARSP